MICEYYGDAVYKFKAHIKPFLSCIRKTFQHSVFSCVYALSRCMSGALPLSTSLTHSLPLYACLSFTRSLPLCVSHSLSVCVCVCLSLYVSVSFLAILIRAATACPCLWSVAVLSVSFYICSSASLFVCLAWILNLCYSVCIYPSMTLSLSLC